jgi:hypothetical protein
MVCLDEQAAHGQRNVCNLEEAGNDRCTLDSGKGTADADVQRLRAVRPGRRVRLLAIRRMRAGQGADKKKTCDDPVCRAFHMMKSRRRSGPGLVKSTRHDGGRRTHSPRSPPRQSNRCCDQPCGDGRWITPVNRRRCSQQSFGGHADDNDFERHTSCHSLPAYCPSERQLTHREADQRETCNLHALLGMAPEVMHVNCGVRTTSKQKERQSDSVLTGYSDHLSNVPCVATSWPPSVSYCPT